MKPVVLRNGLFCSILTVISILIFGYVSHAEDSKGGLKKSSGTIVQIGARGKLPEIDANFVASSPAIVAYAAFSGSEVALNDGSTALIHDPLTSSDATSLIVTFRSNQEMPLNETEWKLFKYNEALVLKQYDSRKINFNDFELDPNFYYYSSWSPNPEDGDKPLVKGLYLCKVTVKAKKSTLKSTIKFKFEVTE